MPADNVQLDKAFTDDLDIDSLSMVEVVVAAEEKFGVKIPDDDVKDLRTVGDAVNYIAQAVPERMTTTPRSDAQTIVVTGLGATTPVGGDAASTWDAMLAGRSGVRSLTEEWASELPVTFAAASRSSPRT